MSGSSRNPSSDAAASALLLQEQADTAQRARLGGAFYVVGWCVVWLGGAVSSSPLAYAVALLFVLGVPLRFRLASRLPAAHAAVWARIDAVWLTVVATTVVWGAASAWVLGVDRSAETRLIATLCTIAFGTAIAHSFCMRLRRALLALSAVYLPLLGATLLTADGPRPAAAIAIYFVYLVLVLRRSHREYRQRLDQEDELRRQRDLFEQHSHRDGLTGLANRRRFSAELDRLAGDTVGGQGAFALMILDLDHFKSINDRYGHAIGDDCLRRFAEHLQRAFSGTDELVARLGGEEFGVLVPALDEDSAVVRADAFRAQLAAAPLVLSGHEVALTVSIGVCARSPGSTGHVETVFMAADEALYRAKAEGRNRVRHCRPRA